MTERSALVELASLVGRTPLTSSNAAIRQRAMTALAARLSPRRRTVGDLLGVVMALSARTRRMILPRVAVELDVFTPHGRRAVEINLGHRD